MGQDQDPSEAHVAPTWELVVAVDRRPYAPIAYPTYRLEVPSGWLYRYGDMGPLCFVPDYRHNPVLPMVWPHVEPIMGPYLPGDVSKG